MRRARAGFTHLESQFLQRKDKYKYFEMEISLSVKSSQVSLSCLMKVKRNNPGRLGSARTRSLFACFHEQFIFPEIMVCFSHCMPLNPDTLKNKKGGGGKNNKQSVIYTLLLEA